MTGDEVRRQFSETGALLSGHFKLSSGLHSETYLQCAKVLQWPERAGALGAALASLLAPFRPSVVVSPAMGGVIIGHEAGRGLFVRAIFAERVDGEFTVRRGFALEPDERVAVVEDVVTTGKSTREVLDVVRLAGRGARRLRVDRRSKSPGREDTRRGRRPVPRAPRARSPRVGARSVPALRARRARRRAGLAPSRGEGVNVRRMTIAPMFVLDAPHYHAVTLGARTTFRGVALAPGDVPIAEVVAYRDGAPMARTPVEHRLSRARVDSRAALVAVPLLLRPRRSRAAPTIELHARYADGQRRSGLLLRRPVRRA